MTDLTTDALCASGQVRALTRAAGDESKAGWIISFDDLQAIRAAAGDWGYGIHLEAVEAIALDVERRILAALTPAPQVDSEHCGCGDKACLACFPAATPAAQEAVPVAWGESYDGGAFFNTVSLTKTRHHTYPLYAHQAQPSVSVAEAALKEARANMQHIKERLVGEWSRNGTLELIETHQRKIDAALRAKDPGATEAMLARLRA